MSIVYFTFDKCLPVKIKSKVGVNGNVSFLEHSGLEQGSLLLDL